jgi:hypothetical protein
LAAEEREAEDREFWFRARNDDFCSPCLRWAASLKLSRERDDKDDTLVCSVVVALEEGKGEGEGNVTFDDGKCASGTPAVSPDVKLRDAFTDGVTLDVADVVAVPVRVPDVEGVG